MVSKLTIEHCYKIAALKGGKCLSTEYKKNAFKLKWQCSCSHIFELTYNHVQQGHWCPKCANHIKSTIEDCVEYANKKEGKCLSTSYVNVGTPLKWQCKCNYIWEACFHQVKGKDSWCPKCAGRAYELSDYQKFAEERNGKCLSDIYISPIKLQSWECKFGHVWQRPFSRMKKTGSWCPECNTFTGQRITKLFFEQMFQESFLNNHRPNWMKNPISKLNLELDGYCPNLNIAFEYNGDQHYKDVNIFSRSKHDDLKQNLCDKNNTKLFIIKQIDHMGDYQKIIDSIKDQSLKFNLTIKNYNININELTLTSPSEESLKDLKELAIKNNLLCLSDTYIGNDSIYLFCCRDHGHFYKSAKKFKNSSVCLKCSAISKGKKISLAHKNKRIKP